MYGETRIPDWVKLDSGRLWMNDDDNNKDTTKVLSSGWLYALRAIFTLGTGLFKFLNLCHSSFK